MKPEAALLASRLQNCLQTILDLENQLATTQLGPLFGKEFATLKQVMGQLEAIDVTEEDVCRVEAATNRFLEELQETFHENANSGGDTRVVQ